MSVEHFRFEINMDKLIRRMSGGQKPPDFAGALERGIKNGLEDVKSQASDKLISILGDYGLLNSGIPEQIEIVIIDKGISIKLVGDGGSATNYAVFVEFGTGVMGEESPHPKAGEEGWEYDVGGHGDSGWWYPTVEGDPNPTKKLTKQGSWVAWTAGMASRPFMYSLWLWASYSVTNIINKNVNAEFRRLESDFK